MRKGSPPPGGNGTRVACGRNNAIRGVVAKTAVVILLALAGCRDGPPPNPEPHAASGTTPDRWTDRHGNVCERLEPGLARCRTPDGHIWYREDVPTPGSLLRDPIKAMMWLLSRGRGDAADGSGPKAGDGGADARD